MTAPISNRTKVWLTIAVFLAFLVGLLGIAAATGWREAIAAVRSLSVQQIALLLLLSLINYGFRCLRWHVYTNAMHIPTSVFSDMRHYLGGFALTATPGRLGELIRLRWIWLETGFKPDRTGALVLIDRAADLASVGILLAICIAASSAGLSGGWTAAIIAVLLAIIVTQPRLLRFFITLGWKTVGILPRLFAMARRAARGLSIFAQPTVFLPATVLGTLGWCAEAFAFYKLLVWMGADIELSVALAIFFLSVLTGGATGLPGGIGGAEAAMIAALSLKGVPLEIALPATAVIRLTTLWFAILIGMAVFPFAERRAERGAYGKPVNAVE